MREAEAFLSRIDGAKPTAVTEEVNRLLRAGMVTRSGCKGDLWQVLHQGGYYKPCQSNWNKQCQISTRIAQNIAIGSKYS